MLAFHRHGYDPRLSLPRTLLLPPTLPFALPFHLPSSPTCDRASAYNDIDDDDPLPTVLLTGRFWFLPGRRFPGTAPDADADADAAVETMLACRDAAW